MVDEYEVDIDKAMERITTVEEWGQQPEIRKHLVPARLESTNSLMGLILTGTRAGAFPNTKEFNQLLMDKLTIAFDLGYFAHYAHDMRTKH